jgi:hypothetical protein
MTGFGGLKKFGLSDASCSGFFPAAFTFNVPEPIFELFALFDIIRAVCLFKQGIRTKPRLLIIEG